MKAGFRMLRYEQIRIRTSLVISVVKLVLMIAEVMIAIELRMHLMESRMLMSMG